MKRTGYVIAITTNTLATVLGERIAAAAPSAVCLARVMRELRQLDKVGLLPSPHAVNRLALVRATRVWYIGPGIKRLLVVLVVQKCFADDVVNSAGYMHWHVCSKIKVSKSSCGSCKPPEASGHSVVLTRGR